MAGPIKILACKTCLRDSPGEGVFASSESIEKEYKSKLKEGWIRKTASFELHSCFAECENFHCLRVFKGKKGFHLKKISNPEKIDQVIEWMRYAKRNDGFEVPECLKENLLYPIKE